MSTPPFVNFQVTGRGRDKLNPPEAHVYDPKFLEIPSELPFRCSKNLLPPRRSLGIGVL